MSELVDDTDSKSVAIIGVWVRVPLPLPLVSCVHFFHSLSYLVSATSNQKVVIFIIQ